MRVQHRWLCQWRAQEQEDRQKNCGAGHAHSTDVRIGGDDRPLPSFTDRYLCPGPPVRRRRAERGHQRHDAGDDRCRCANA